MSAYLSYRFPEKDVKEFTGNFIPMEDFDDYEGFLLTNFDISSSFGFIPDETQHEKHLCPSKDRPYVMTAREYYLQAHELLNGMNTMQMEKAVFSRVKSVKFDFERASLLFERLCQTYPKAFVYFFSDSELGTWIGASPEIILEVHQGFLFTTALAGTKKTEEEEWTEKERHEQEIVSDFIVDELKKMGIKSIESIGPYDFNTGAVIHIKTDISADLNLTSTWKVLKALHPTPATGGFPKSQAIELIHAVEPHERKFYTGVIGYLGKQQSRLYVNLRCAELSEEEAFLYLGGGYTLQSIPELEWVETENKSKTLLNCMQ